MKKIIQEVKMSKKQKTIILTIKKTGILIFLSILTSMTTSAQLQQAKFPQSPQHKTLEKALFLIKTVGSDEFKEAQKSKEQRIQGRNIFKAGEKILIQTSIKNRSEEVLKVVNSSWQYQYGFDLWRVDGESKIPRGSGTVSKRKELQPLFYERENDQGAGSITPLPPVMPGKSMELLTLDLDEVYDKLEPGRYKLTIFYRGLFKARKLASNSIILEIVR